MSWTYEVSEINPTYYIMIIKLQYTWLNNYIKYASCNIASSIWECVNHRSSSNIKRISWSMWSSTSWSSTRVISCCRLSPEDYSRISSRWSSCSPFSGTARHHRWGVVSWVSYWNGQMLQKSTKTKAAKHFNQLFQFYSLFDLPGPYNTNKVKKI